MLGDFLGKTTLDIIDQVDPEYGQEIRTKIANRDKKKMKLKTKTSSTDEEKRRIQEMMAPSKRNINVR